MCGTAAEQDAGIATLAYGEASAMIASATIGSTKTMSAATANTAALRAIRTGPVAAMARYLRRCSIEILGRSSTARGIS
jgi:hypothetical protein